MKKLLFSILFIGLASICFAQPKIVRTTAANTVYDTRHGALLNEILPVYLDTNQANLTSNLGIDSCGALIFTYADSGKVYIRRCFPVKYWSAIGGGGNGSGSSLTLQQVFDLENAKAVMNKDDTVQIGSNKFVFYHPSGGGAWLKLDFTEPWIGGVQLDMQNLSEGMFVAKGNDVGEVRNIVTNTYNLGASGAAAGMELSQATTFGDLNVRTDLASLGSGGTIAPNGALLITTGAMMKFATSDTGYFAWIRGRAIAPTVAFTEMMRLTKLGYLGIGLTAPTYRLQVTDSTKLSGIAFTRRDEFGGPTMATAEYLTIWNYGVNTQTRNLTQFQSVYTDIPNELRFMGGNSTSMANGTGVINGFNYDGTQANQRLYFITSGFNAIATHKGGSMYFIPGTNFASQSVRDYSFPQYTGDSVVIKLNTDAAYRPYFYVRGRQHTTDSSKFDNIAYYTSNIHGKFTDFTHVDKIYVDSLIAIVGVTPTWDATLTAQSTTVFGSTHTVNFGDKLQTWNANGAWASQQGILFQSSSTDLTGAGQARLLDIRFTGNQTGGAISSPLYVVNSHTTVGGINIGGDFTASNSGNTNIAVRGTATGTSSQNIGVQGSASGTTGDNIGIYATATGGSTNTAINVPVNSGNVVLGIAGSSGTASLLHLNISTTTATTTASGIVEVMNSLTTGTGHYISSSTITSGTILDIATTSGAALAGSNGLKISRSGTNATNAITVVGETISVINTNATSGTNIGLDITASGATTNNIALRLFEPAASGTNFTGFKTQAQGADIIYTWPATVGGAGTVLTDAAGDGILSWAAASASVTWNGISNPTGDQALTFDVGESSTWTNSNTTEDLLTINSSTLTTASFLSLNSTSTALAAGNNLAEFVMSGANGSSSITATAIRASVTNSGTTNTNIAIDATATGGATDNWAVNATGNIKITTANTTQVTTSAGLNVNANSLTTGTGAYIVSSTLTSGTLLQIVSTSTTLAANNEGLDIAISGANGTNAITATGMRSTVTNTNATSGTNIAAQFNASGATTANWALFTGSATGADGRININNATNVANQVAIFKSLTNTATDGISIRANNESASMQLGYQTISTTGGMNITTSATGLIVSNIMSVGTAATATSTIISGGSFAAGYVAKTANYTATISDFTIECTANTFQVTLPTAVGITGRIYYIVNSGAGTITIGTTSSQTFVNVTATPTTLTMATIGSTAVQSNGANWMRLSSL